MASAKRRRRPNGSGWVDQLPSGRWRARFNGPDGVMRAADQTFFTRLDAQAWLAQQQDRVRRGIWIPDSRDNRKLKTFESYANAWLEQRPLKPSTKWHYRKILDSKLIPAFGCEVMQSISPSQVRGWFSCLDKAHPTANAHAYGLLRTIMNTAIEDELIEANPCRIRGAGRAKVQHKAIPATLSELDLIVAAIPSRYKLMVLIAAWCGLRFGELVELRRSDIDTTNRTICVERGASLAFGEVVIGTPKTDAGRRVVAIPPHLIAAFDAHLSTQIGPERHALLFPARHGGTMAASTMTKVFKRACRKAGRPDLTLHMMRHTSATMIAATGCTLKDAMMRLGHATPSMALRYQHSLEGRDQAIAEALSEFAAAKAITLRAPSIHTQ